MSATALPAALLEPHPFSLPKEERLACDRSEVLRYLGHSGQAIDADLMARIEAVIDEVERTARPRGIWMMATVDAQALMDGGEPRIRLTGTSIELEGRDIYRHLKDARWCAVLACTLGLEHERQLRARSIGNPLEATVFDAASSAAIEAAVERMEHHIRKLAKFSGLSCNWRFSCGYGDCPLAAQGGILAALDTGRRLGLTLTPSGLMLPSKSVTAMIGVFEGAPRSADAPARCDLCRQKAACSFRARGFTC